LITTRPLLYAETRFAGIHRWRITPGFPFQFFIWPYEYDLRENEGGIGGWTRYKGLVFSRYYIIQTINQVLAGEVPFTGPRFFCTVFRQIDAPMHWSRTHLYKRVHLGITN